MTLPALPPPNSAAWYAHYAAIDAAVRGGGGSGGGSIVKGPTLPTVPTGEYIWFKTDGTGRLLDILSGVAT